MSVDQLLWTGSLSPPPPHHKDLEHLNRDNTGSKEEWGRTILIWVEGRATATSSNFHLQPGIPGGKVRTFPALFANICRKSTIFVHQTTRKLHVIHAAPRATIAHATRALTGVKNIEFSVLIGIGKLCQHNFENNKCA